MANPGRPTKLTADVQDKIVAAIRAGNYAHVAAQYAGIGERTFYRWMERGEAAGSGKYRRFRDAVKVAESEAEVRAVATIQRQMPDNWRAAVTYLERRHPSAGGGGWTSPRATSRCRRCCRFRFARRRRRWRR